jgi:hypothetical protein
MSEINTPSLAAQVDFLVRRMFGYAVANTLMRGGRVTAEHNECLMEAAEYAAELYDMQPDKVQELFEQEHEKERIEQQVAADREEAQRFFNQPWANADSKHWGKAAYWTIDEGVALLLGKAPEVVNWESVRDYADVSPFAWRYAKLRDLVQRMQHTGQLGWSIKPGTLLEWAKRAHLEYPSELEKEVLACGHQIADWKSLHDEVQAKYNELKAQCDEAQARLDENEKLISSLVAERDSLRLQIVELEQASEQGQAKDKPLLTKERGTLLKLIIGMAVKGYCYNPDAERSDKINDIVHDLDCVGVSLDDDTVRKWLREAAGLLPRKGLDGKDR